MKFKGQQFKSVARGVFILSRPGDGDPIEIKLKALPLGFEEKIEGVFPNPKPPKKYARDARGRIIKHEGKAVLEDDEHDPDYLSKRSDVSKLHMMYFITESIDDERWTFEAEKPEDISDKDEAKAYYDALWLEFQAAGFSSGDIVGIVNRIMEISNLRGEDMEAMRDSF